jgi:hypothetical protein
MQPSVTAADLEIFIATFLDHWAGRNVSVTANFSKTLHDAGHALPHRRQRIRDRLFLASFE